MAKLPTLGYWDIRGLGEPIRYLLRYAGVDFIDKRYKYDEAANEPKKQWMDEKFALGLHFSNLPYLIDGDVKVTQSKAILRYLGRKHGLDGKSEAARVRIDMAEHQTIDLRNGLRHVCIFDPETLGEYFKTTGPLQMEMYSKFLGSDPWIAGNDLTYVDFFLFETLDFHRMLEPNCLDKTPNLKSYVHRFAQIPQIESYRSSGQFHALPIFLPFAKLLNRRE